MKTLFSFLLLTIASLAFTGCGDDEDDPKPAKTNLQIVQEGIIGNWELQTVTLNKGAETVVYNGGCDESNLPAWAQANVGDIDFDFKSETTVTQSLNCPSLNEDNFSYEIRELSSGSFVIEIDNGMEFELITSPTAIEDAIYVEVKVTPLIQGATTAIWKFKKE
jgi:hypothetical protein